MPSFKYKARKQGGAIIEGTLEAASASAAAHQLLTQGSTPITVEAAATAGSADVGELFQKIFPPKVKLEELIVLCRQLYTLIKAGVPITRTIAGLADNARNPTLTKALREVTEALESGRELTAAMGAHPKVFPTLMISIIQVGENTGQLDTAFNQISAYLEKELETGKRIKSALRYPTFVIGAVVVCMVIINIFVIPAFAGVFESLDAELPMATIILLNTSRFCVNYWPYMLGVVFLASYGFRQWAQTEHGRFLVDRYKLRLPVVGSIIERATLSRFARSFAMCMSAGVPLISTLSVIGRSVDNEYMAHKVQGMRNVIERGESLINSAAASGLFTPLVLQMLSVGEATGSVDELMVEVADFYEREVDYDLKQVGDAIEPIMIVIIGGMVLVLALGVYLPMWNLGSAMSG